MPVAKTALYQPLGCARFYSLVAKWSDTRNEQMSLGKMLCPLWGLPKVAFLPTSLHFVQIAFGTLQT